MYYYVFNFLFVCFYRFNRVNGMDGNNELIRYLHLYWLAAVTDGLATAVGSNDGELPLLQHAGVSALARADCQGAAAFLPTDWNGGIDAFLIVVVVAFVLVEREGGIGSRVETQFKVVPLLLPDVLHDRFSERISCSRSLKGSIISLLRKK